MIADFRQEAIIRLLCKNYPKHLYEVIAEQMQVAKGRNKIELSLVNMVDSPILVQAIILLSEVSFLSVVLVHRHYSMSSENFELLEDSWINF